MFRRRTVVADQTRELNSWPYAMVVIPRVDRRRRVALGPRLAHIRVNNLKLPNGGPVLPSQARGNEKALSEIGLEALDTHSVRQLDMTSVSCRRAVIDVVRGHEEVV